MWFFNGDSGGGEGVFSLPRGCISFLYQPQSWLITAVHKDFSGLPWHLLLLKPYENYDLHSPYWSQLLCGLQSHGHNQTASSLLEACQGLLKTLLRRTKLKEGRGDEENRSKMRLLPPVHLLQVLPKSKTSSESGGGRPLAWNFSPFLSHFQILPSHQDG